MHGSTLTSAVGLTFLSVHGALVLCPFRESVSHTSPVLAFAAECLWVLWENIPPYIGQGLEPVGEPAVPSRSN